MERDHTINEVIEFFEKLRETYGGDRIFRLHDGEFSKNNPIPLDMPVVCEEDCVAVNWSIYEDDYGKQDQDDEDLDKETTARLAKMRAEMMCMPGAFMDPGTGASLYGRRPSNA